jgi:tetratricopeptide (TPR) repeat protein
MIGRIACILAALVLAAGVDRIHAEIPSTPKSAKGEAFVPQPQLARTASLGFDTLASDYYWLQAIQLVGGAVEDPAAHGYTIGRLIDVVTQLDPHVGHAYRFAAIWMTANEDDVRFANRLMARGIEYHPDDWRNYFYKGFNHFYYLGEYAEAADDLEAAIELPGHPAYLRRLVPRLRSQTEGLEVAQAMLMELHRNAPGPEARANYEKALDELETERRARMLDAARAEYQRRHGHDIEKVEDLVVGPKAVLRELPPELHGWEWTIDPKSDQIVSSYYEARYQVHQQYRPNKFAPSTAKVETGDRKTEEGKR